MILVDTEIKAQVYGGDLRVEPFREECLQAASLDVHLSPHFRIFDLGKHEAIDPKLEQPQLTKLVGAPINGFFVLHPTEFVLASTVEWFAFPADVTGRLEGKSSLGRLGLLIHSTAGFFDPGFQGHPTLELSNAAGLPIRLYPNMPIGQMCFMRTEHPAQKPYTGKYQNQGPVPAPSQYWRNFTGGGSGPNYGR